MLAQLLFERLARLLERLTAGWCDANRGQRPVRDCQSCCPVSSGMKALGVMRCCCQ